MPRPPGLIQPIETLLRLDRPLLRGVEIYDWCARHGIEPTASIVNAMLMSGGILAPVTTIYDCTGADQTYTVPWGIYWLKVELWGAAGAGITAFGVACYGGAGGYTTGLLSVTPGEVLTIIVGLGGPLPTRLAQTALYGGGGPGANGTSGAQGYNSCGGGRTAIRRASGTEVATAGGGGGGQPFNSGSQSGWGGAGGGLAGAVGLDRNTNGYSARLGGAGTQTAGGAAGTGTSNATAGSQYQGGTGHRDGVDGGAGGGGGLFGGGGGGGAGGGGSGYIGGLINATTTVGTNYTPPGTTSSNYAIGIGVGGLDADAGNGRIVITTVP
jgi:hypothetical protein